MSDSSFTGPAYRIETARTVLRCWQLRDVHLLQAAVEASMDHLQPWMPWAKPDENSLAQKIELLRKFRGNFDLDQEYVYGVFDLDENQVLGGTGLHPCQGAHALEIGYWIHVDHINQGYATEISAAQTKVAFLVHKVQRVEIHCRPDNVRSAAVPRKLGFTHEATLRRRHSMGPDTKLEDDMVWTLLDDEFADSPSAQIACKAFDAVGTQIL